MTRRFLSILGGCCLAAILGAVLLLVATWQWMKRGAPRMEDLEFLHRVDSPDGRHCVATAFWKRPDEWSWTLAVGSISPNGETVWSTVYDWPWPDFSVLECEWTSNTNLRVTCVDNTWLGLPTSRTVLGGDVVVNFAHK